MDVLSLAQKLVQFNTINPPGNEKDIAEFCGELLRENGFNVKYYPYKENRLNVVAEIGLTERIAPIVFSGHLDVVPLGQEEWTVEPFSGEIKDGKLFGRGSADMKGGVAAMIDAAIQSAQTIIPEGGIRIILSASEEDGCKGITHLAASGVNLGKARGIIIGEPTGNMPICAHKGALYMWVRTKGVSAHSSMPQQGINAIYKAARAVTKIENFKFKVEKDPLLGMPTINVGVIKGGMNMNSVPDIAEFSIDIRSTTKLNHKQIVHELQTLFGHDFTIDILVDRLPVFTDENDPFVFLIDKILQVDRTKGLIPKGLPYFTDGSVLQEYYKGAPTVIWGPGQAKMAHQTDEYCEVEAIKEAQKNYYQILNGG